MADGGGSTESEDVGLTFKATTWHLATKHLADHPPHPLSPPAISKVMTSKAMISWRARQQHAWRRSLCGPQITQSRSFDLRHTRSVNTFLVVWSDRWLTDTNRHARSTVTAALIEWTFGDDGANQSYRDPLPQSGSTTSPCTFA